MTKISLAIALVMTAGAAVAAPTPKASPFLGRWTLDTGSAAAPTGAGPASVTAEFADGGAGSWNTTYVLTAKDDSVRRMTSRERLDGTAVAVAGDPTIADSVAMTNPLPGVLVMGLSKEGKLEAVRVYTVSADGRVMTENATFVGGDGKPTVRQFRWVR